LRTPSSLTSRGIRAVLPPAGARRARAPWLAAGLLAAALLMTGDHAVASVAAPIPASVAPAAASAPATTAPLPIWGIGDQQPQFFGDPRWRALPLRHVRYFVPWDLRREPRYLRLADQWMKAARRNHTIPLVAITQSDLRGRTHILPGARQYRQEVGWTMRRFAWVREWTPWNEANLSLQATLRRPGMAALYWRLMRRLCAGCTVTSPSLVGYTHNAPRGWMRRFLRAAHGLHGPWAVHLYNDINEFHPYALGQLSRQLPSGPIWVTEVGGWKHFAHFPAGLAHQTRAVRYLFELAPKTLPRVVRWYLYQWHGSPRGFRWDSGLINANGTPRPALRIVQHFLLPPAIAPPL
jgi:putative glycosyl hydrolase